MHRRRFLATAAALSVPVATAGCLGEDSLQFEADPATVGSDALADAGYEGEEPESFTMERTIDTAGVDATVSATTWTANYTSQESGGALFVASTPNATVAGQSVNPLVRGDDLELIERVIEQFGDQNGGEGLQFEDFERRGSETRTILDTETEVVTFETTVESGAGGPGGNAGGSIGGAVEGEPGGLGVDGRTDVDGWTDVDGGDAVRQVSGEIPVLGHLATVQHDGDVIALLGVHPQPVDERETLLSLMESVQH